MTATDQPTPHEFTEDVDDYSMCVCGVPADAHHLIDQPTPRVGDTITTAAADSLPVGSVIGYVGGAAHREYQGARPVWKATNGGIYHSAKPLLHEYGALTVLSRPGAPHPASVDDAAVERAAQYVREYVESGGQDHGIIMADRLLYPAARAGEVVDREALDRLANARNVRVYGDYGAGWRDGVRAAAAHFAARGDAAPSVSAEQVPSAAAAYTGLGIDHIGPAEITRMVRALTSLGIEVRDA